MKVKMLVALAASVLAGSFAFAEPAMQAADNLSGAQQAPASENIGAPSPTDQQMLSDNSNMSGTQQMPGDIASSDDATADNATGDDY